MSPGVWIALFVVFVVVILILRAKGETRVGGDFSTSPSMPPQPGMPTAAAGSLDQTQRDRLLNAIKSGNKMEAIKLYVEATGASLEDAKAVVEKMSKIVGVLGNILPDTDTAASEKEEADWDEIEELLIAGNKMEAIKLYREQTGSDLKEAREAVEAYEAENKHNF